MLAQLLTVLMMGDGRFSAHRSRLIQAAESQSISGNQELFSVKIMKYLTISVVVWYMKLYHTYEYCFWFVISAANIAFFYPSYPTEVLTFIQVFKMEILVL